MDINAVEGLTPSDSGSEVSIPLCQPSQEEVEDSDVSDTMVTFRDYISNFSKVPTKDRNKFILGACHGVVPNFNLKVAPYLQQTNHMLPINIMLKQELLRRNPQGKGLRKKT